MLSPFQRLLYCSRNSHRQIGVVLAASGPTIYSFSAQDGSLLARWSHAAKINSTAETVSNGHTLEEKDEPPGKRRKLSSREPSESPSAEIVVENDGKKRRKPKAKAVQISPVIKLCGTDNGEHVVAVTAEDKCVHVLEVLADGSLNHLSERHMPKKPNAITFTTDQRTILCADKFGDVYALPLVQAPSSSDSTLHGSAKATSKQDIPSKSNSPSASALTVHSKKNREALRHQLHVHAVNKVVEKRTMDFDNQLLLGHVSLLTDMAYATLQSKEGDRPISKSYIVTSDRDEHIRISRGLPQAHIIEGYCLGHSQFISKICIPTWRTDLLISGGGDDYLLVWHWLSGTQQQKLDLRSPVDALKSKSRLKHLDSSKTSSIAVSGIWALQPDPSFVDGSMGDLIVAVESVPALFVYSMSPKGDFFYRQTLALEGNVVDVAVSQDLMSIFYTLDNVHKPWTTAIIAKSKNIPFIGVKTWTAETNTWCGKPEFFEFIDVINRWSSSKQEESEDSESQRAGLGELLYGIENLRKRDQEEQ